MRFSRIILAVAALLLVLVSPRNTFAAVAYDLIPPSGTLTRGQDVQFIIDIDTQGTSITNPSVGMTYNTDYLQYKSITAGDAVTSISATQPSTGNLLISGTNAAGFNGVGTLAYVTFTLIAQAPGSTELCVLYAPSETPVPTTPPVGPTTPPQPTALPKTGDTVQGTQASAIGGVLLLSAVGLYVWYNRSKYEVKPRRHKKHA